MDKSKVMNYCTHRGWRCYDQGSKLVAVDDAADKKSSFVPT
jgi:hypothetical protein